MLLPRCQRQVSLVGMNIDTRWGLPACMKRLSPQTSSLQILALAEVGSAASADHLLQMAAMPLEGSASEASVTSPAAIPTLKQRSKLQEHGQSSFLSGHSNGSDFDKECYTRANVALSRATDLTVLARPLNMHGLEGAAQVIAALLHGVCTVRTTDTVPGTAQVEGHFEGPVRCPRGDCCLPKCY